MKTHEIIILNQGFDSASPRILGRVLIPFYEQLALVKALSTGAFS